MAVVACEDACDLTYACVLEEQEQEVLWVQVQLPTRRWWRGPYSDRDQACAAASALDCVARRRWAQESKTRVRTWLLGADE